MADDTMAEDKTIEKAVWHYIGVGVLWLSLFFTGVALERLGLTTGIFSGVVPGEVGLLRTTFRLLAEKEILAPMHTGKYGDRSIWCAPRDGKNGTLAFSPCNIPWEKRPIWVVEGLPTAYSQYAFSKRLMYIDRDTIGVVFMEAYDQGGELWKLFFNLFNFTKKPYEGYPTRPIEGAKYNYEDEWAFDPNGMMMDIQTAHASPWDAPSGYLKPSDWVNEWYFNEATPINTEAAFSINHLIQSAR